MILKMMKDDHIGSDEDHRKSCRILANVNEVNMSHESTGEARLDVFYSVPNRGLSQEAFILSANAYLMNDSGKTIQAFSPNAFAPGVQPSQLKEPL